MTLADVKISIHASRGGSDGYAIRLLDLLLLFQSTLPAGEATDIVLINVADFIISIHASRGGSDVTAWRVSFSLRISIHASRGGSDTRYWKYATLSTISIHASRGGSDGQCSGLLFQLYNFNPRFPRGKRRRIRNITSNFIPFQSTLPAGEATITPGTCDLWPIFQSTLPAGEATSGGNSSDLSSTVISIHASRGGSD